MREKIRDSQTEIPNPGPVQIQTTMRKILIVRLSAMGDILHALPAVTALRNAMPDAEIGWLVESRWQALLRVHAAAMPRSPEQPLVDRVHASNMAEWRRSWASSKTRREIAASVRELRKIGYDTVIDFQGAVRSALFARASGAPTIVGEDAPREWIARFLFSARVATAGAHVIQQDLEVASTISGHPLHYTPARLPYDREANTWASTQAPEERLILINPGAGWGAKCWPAERYAQVARALEAEGGSILVNAGPGEAELAASVARGCKHARAIECNLTQLIALMRRTKLFIGGDTGPLHLAAALQVPAVAIFGPTDPARNGPYQTESIVLRSRVSRRDHARRAEPEEGLLQISAEKVIEAAQQLFGGAA